LGERRILPIIDVEFDSEEEFDEERGLLTLTRVVATGTFDILHPGHVLYLERSRALGTSSS
jgi:bifunctional ADP-heptose synthase (sugar kinase/adenylyltransferase)